jgi:anti-sigma B factor antagonist
MEPTLTHLRVHHPGEKVLALGFQNVALLFERPVIQAVGAELYGLVDRHGDHRIILSFRDIDYISSEMLGKLVSLRRRVLQKGGELVLCHMNTIVREVFTASHLDSLFEIVPDEAAALAVKKSDPPQVNDAGPATE